MKRSGWCLLLAFLLTVVNVNIGFAGAYYIETASSSLSQDVFSKLYEQSYRQVVLVINFGKGHGSGFVWSGDGIILTNAHVIKEAQAVEVYIDDRKHYPAKIIGYDSEFDVGVLKIDAESILPVALLGNSDQVKVGEWVYAIGSPYGLKDSLSVGVVGGLHRYMNLGVQEVMQLDMILNPGNSGGPLYNLRGEIIGMNVMILKEAGIGFAIPINDVVFVAKEILQNGKVKYSRLGVALGELAEIFSEDIAKKANLTWPLLQKQGVVVVSVGPGSPANIAGLQSGDIIISFNGQQVDKLDKFRRLIALSPSGVSLKMVIKRVGVELTLQVILVERSAIKDKDESKEEFILPLPTPVPTPTPVPIPPVPQEGGINFGEGLNILPPQVRQAILEYQGLLSEVSIDFGGQIQLRSTNAFAVDSQYVITVASFLNPNVLYAFTAKYIFNGIPANFVTIAPPGLALFKLESPYPNYKNLLVWSDIVKVGNIYHSLVIKNLGNGDSLPYVERLLNKVGQALIFSAKLKKIGYGAPIFNSSGEVIGMWLGADKNDKDPEDVYDSTVVVSAGLIKKFAATVIEQNKDKK